MSHHPPPLRLSAYACALGLAAAAGVPAQAQAPDPCMTPDLVAAVLQATNQANAAAGQELTGVSNGRTTARAQNGLTCTYDGVMKAKGGAPGARVVVTGKITVAADGTDIDTHVEPAR